MTSLPQSWDDYCTQELAKLAPLLSGVGMVLDDAQPHLRGERALIGGNKLVLVGRRISDGKRVVIKASRHPEGQREMLREQVCRTLLNEIKFAYNVFFSPEQLVWHDTPECVVSITAFLEQTCAFLDRSLVDQFSLAIKAFETQESAHATTYEHTRTIRSAFEIYHASTYLESFQIYRQGILSYVKDNASLPRLLERAEQLLREQAVRIEQYAGFLTHTDFVPHNFRVVGHDIYLLDHSSIRFANKYDGWARFLNFMLLHHRELETAMMWYVEHNRAPEEYQALHLMRVYRLGEIIWYYASHLEKTTGNLRVLYEVRIAFWTDALQSFLDHHPLSEERIQSYRSLRDQLRSDEEKQRQLGLH